MKVGILGTGDAGRALAQGFLQLGHEVKVGSRDPNQEKVTNLVAGLGGKASAGTFAQAASFGSVIALATLGVATEEAIRLAGPASFKGKVVIDATNPLLFRDQGPPGLAVGHSDSQGERVQRWIPEAKVVKAFNIVGNTSFFQPSFPDGTPDMWICGNDEDAKKSVAKILNDFGWPSVIDIGGIEGARYLEPLCLLWVMSGFRLGNFNIAFRILKK